MLTIPPSILKLVHPLRVNQDRRPCAVVLNSSMGSFAGWLHAWTDATIATIAAGTVLLLFYPLTLCAAGAKGLLRIVDRTTKSSAAKARKVPNGIS